MANVYNSSGGIITRAYNSNGELLTMCYDSQGNQLRKGHAVSNNVTRSLLMIPDIPTGTQGFACDSITQTIAQFYTGYMYFIDITDGSAVKSNNINLGHGHTGQFAPTKTADQEYPLLYVSGPNETVNEIYYTYMLEIGCETNTAITQKVYAVPANSTRTSCRTVVDFENNIVYHVSAETYYGTADYTYITAWDMNSSELLDGATFNSAPIYALTHKLDEFQVPFIPEIQSCTFFDGLIVLLSDKSGAANKYYQFVDVEMQDVYLTIDKTALMLSGELEGVGFMYNNSTGKYDMIVSHRTSDGAGSYVTEFHRYEFN